MRILLLCDEYSPHGTTSVSVIVRNLEQDYRRRGHEVSILSTHRTETSGDIVREGNCVSLPSSYRAVFRGYRCLWSPRMSAMVKEEMRRAKPDIVHAHNIHLHLTYDALRIAKSVTPHVFITLHDVMSFAFSRLSTERFLDSGGNDCRLTVRDHVRSVGIVWNPLRNMWIRHAFRRYVTRAIAVSDALRSALEQNGIKGASVIHNGVNVREWGADEAAVQDFRNRHELTGRKVLLFGGRLSTDKGAIPLLHAINELRREFPSLLLLVAGERHRWEKLLTAAGIDDDLSPWVRCTGWLDRHQMPLACAAADIVTTPSLCLDCFPSLNIEAMASGTPVVGTLFGGTPEAVVDGVTGFVRDPRATGYTDALRTLLRDPTAAKRMGEEGKKRVDRYFTSERQSETYLALFSEALSTR